MIPFINFGFKPKAKKDISYDWWKELRKLTSEFQEISAEHDLKTLAFEETLNESQLEKLRELKLSAQKVNFVWGRIGAIKEIRGYPHEELIK